MQFKKEDILHNYPCSEDPSEQSIKVDDVYPHKIPLQVQSITDDPEPLDCTLKLHGQKDGEDFTRTFRLCNPRKAVQVTSPKCDYNRGKQTCLNIGFSVCVLKTAAHHSKKIAALNTSHASSIMMETYQYYSAVPLEYNNYSVTECGHRTEQCHNVYIHLE